MIGGERGVGARGDQQIGDTGGVGAKPVDKKQDDLVEPQAPNGRQTGQNQHMPRRPPVRPGPPLTCHCQHQQDHRGIKTGDVPRRGINPLGDCDVDLRQQVHHRLNPLVRVEHVLRVIGELFFAVQQPFGCHRCKGRAIEIQASDLANPCLELLELVVLLLKLGVGELFLGNLLGDLGIERITFSDEPAVLIITIGLEACDHLVLLRLVQ